MYKAIKELTQCLQGVRSYDEQVDMAEELSMCSHAQLEVLRGRHHDREGEIPLHAQDRAAILQHLRGEVRIHEKVAATIVGSLNELPVHAEVRPGANPNLILPPRPHQRQSR